MAEVILRSMTEADLDQIMAIENACFAAPWSYDEMWAECSNEMAHYLVAECEGRVAAYGGYWLIVDEAHITNIATSPDFRRRGIGEKLVRALMAQAKEQGAWAMTLEVRVSNTPARTLYEKCGFTLAGIRPGYYPDNGEDAGIYWAQQL